MKRSPRLFVASLAAIAAAVLVVSAPANAAPTSDADDYSSETDALLRETVDDDLLSTMLQLEDGGVLGARSEFLSIIAETRAASDGALEILYYSADSDASERLHKAVEGVGDTSLKVNLVPVTFDPAAVEKRALELSTSGSEALASLGLTDVNFVETNTETGHITVYTDDKISDAARSADPGISIEAGLDFDFQTRQTDSPPFSGGASLSWSQGEYYVDCTAGFNWVKWNTNEIMGSSANHCYTKTGISTWWVGPQYYGQRYYYNTLRDTMLMRGPGYNPNVFVGGTNTNDIRPVVAAVPSPPVDKPIALSGGHSGLSVGTILNTTITIQGTGPFRKTSVTSCLDGDSGGPWLTTGSDGSVTAHGQHGGRQFNPNTGATVSCVYMPVHLISNALSATLYTY